MSVGGRLSFRRRVRAVADASLPVVVGGDDPPSLSELVPPGFESVAIEVGPGKGAFLLAATLARPTTFWIGIEAAPAYAKLAAERLATAGRRNVVLLIDNAAQFLRDRTPAGSIESLHVYFPDPWPKRRHRGRRFFGESIADAVHRVLAPAGRLLCATDNAAYAGQIARVLGKSPRLVRDSELERELLAAGPGHAFSPTEFERKYSAEGRIIRRLAFRRSEPSA
jgi:tRNA (guanine-N7-)-methyltransferase